MAKTKIEVDLVIKGGESVEQVETKTKSLKAQLREMKALLASGTLDNQAFSKLSAEAGALQDQIGDVNEQVRNLASDSQKLDGLISITQGIVGGFAAVQGVTALVGDENEDLQKTMVKLQGAMSALAGIQAVANTLNKTSAATTTFQAIQLRVLNFVEAQRAASLQYTTVAMQRATFAARMFGAALATLGIGALIAGVVYLIPKITEWVTGSEAATKAQDELTEAIDASNSALESYNKNIDFTTKLAISFAKRQGKSAEEIAKITIDSEEKKLKALEKSYSEQGALYDKLLDGMISGSVKMDKDLLKQTEDANLKLYDSIVEQGNKVALLKADSDTEEIVRQREANKKASDEQKAANKKKAEEALQEKIRLGQMELKRKEEDANNEKELVETVTAEEKSAEDKKTEEAEFTRAYNLQKQIEYYKLHKEIDAKANAQAIKDKQDVENAKIAIVNDSYLALNNLGELALGQQFKTTAAGKTLALAQIATDTAVAYMKGLRIAQEGAAATGPAAPFAMPVFYASQIAAITGAALKAKSILGGGGSTSAPSGSGASGGGSMSSQPPRLDTFQSNRNPMSANQRVYVLEKDITDSQGRVARIRHNATLI